MNYCYYIFTPKGVNYFLQYLLFIFFPGTGTGSCSQSRVVYISLVVTDQRYTENVSFAE